MLKRLFDIIVASVGLVALFPVLLASAIAIKVTSRGPVFYGGTRVGRNGRNFRMLKFRTMVIDADRIGGPSTSDDDSRITTVGSFLRRYKIDELPQLFNVVGGSMSLVGPRPPIQEDVVEYTREEREILSVRPGITDFASIRFHNEGEILKGHPDPHQAYIELIRPEKLRLCLQYVRTQSFWTDMKILWMTFLRLRRRRSRVN